MVGVALSSSGRNSLPQTTSRRTLVRIFGLGKKQKSVKTEQVTVADLREGDAVREGQTVSKVVVVLPAHLDTNHVKVGLADGSNFLAREDETVYRVLTAA
jgi:hypothetical protein